MPSISLLLLSGSKLLQTVTTDHNISPSLHSLHWYNYHLYPLLHSNFCLNKNNQCPVASYLLLSLSYLIPRNASFSVYAPLEDAQPRHSGRSILTCCYGHWLVPSKHVVLSL